MNLDHPTVKRLIELVAANPQYHRRSGDAESLTAFWSQFPKDELDQISMEDYILGKGSKPRNFCWWLERGLEKALGRYMPGSSKGHVLYREQDGSIYKHRKLAELSDAEALDYVARLHKVFATADTSKSLTWLDDADQVFKVAGTLPLHPMGPGRRLRIVAVYNPDTVLPIFSSPHIAHFLEQLGVSTAEIPLAERIFARHQVLFDLFQQICSRVPTLTPYGFVQALFSDALGIKPERESNDEDEDSEDAWDSEAIHQGLIALGFPPNPAKAHPAYAYEHVTGEGRYIYVKRGADGPRRRQPLVLHPESVGLRSQIDAVSGVQARWDSPTKSTSYRHYPKLEGKSQYGYPVDVTSQKGLAKLMEVIGGTTRPTVLKTVAGEEMTTQSAELNQILYGPPGTGKTYKTTEEAVRLASPARYKAIVSSSADEVEERQKLKAAYDELVKANRIRFVTFHQSFSYEDFVEGVKATTDEHGKLIYRVEDGLFKELSTIADAQVTRPSHLDGVFKIADRRIWKMSLGNTLADEDNAYEECIDGGYIGLGWGGNINFSGCDSRQAVEQRFSEVKGVKPAGGSYDVTAVNTFKNVMRERDIVVVSDGNHKFRAIGEVTGRYEFSEDESQHFRQHRPVRWLRVFDPSLPREALFSKTLSQMTLYELKPSTIKVEELTGFLSEPAKNHADHRNHVLIIDEINRGNISRIFGELITLLEPDKRKGGADARVVTLPYSGDNFSIPSNLYVIGTMNTADKSLAQLDLALRRRFSFTEVLPEPDLLRGIVIHGVDIGEMLQTINDRIEMLLDRDHLIGHSYFFSLREDDGDRDAQLARIFESKIIPLLQEYFFSDWERIRWVLNDIGKAPAHQFVQMLKDVTGRPAPFGANPPKDLPEDRRYRINREALNSPEAYQGIKS